MRDGSLASRHRHHGGTQRHADSRHGNRRRLHAREQQVDWWVGPVTRSCELSWRNRGAAD